MDNLLYIRDPTKEQSTFRQSYKISYFDNLASGI